MNTKTFPNHQQEPGSKVCGPACLQNIYEFIHKKVSQKDILSELHITDKDSTYLSQLARHLSKNNVKTTLVSANSYIYAPEWKNVSKETLITELKEWLALNVEGDAKDWVRMALYDLYYLQEGGQIELKNIVRSDLDLALSSGNLILATFEETQLWQRRKIRSMQEYNAVRGHANGHFVVIFNQDDDHYIVSDPYPTKLKNKEGIYKVPKDDAISGIYLRGANYLVIKP